MREKPVITFTNEFDDYPSADEEFSLEEAELEALITFQIATDDGIQSFESIDQRYGRVQAYKVEAEWPLAETRRRQLGSRRKLRQQGVDSVADLFLDVDSDVDSTVQNFIPGTSPLPIENCEEDHHLTGLSEEKKAEVTKYGDRKCVNLAEADLGGGTEEGATENIVVIQW